MRSARHFPLILRLVLAWFVLSLGAAVASPLIKPQDVLLVCTGSGAMKVLVKTTDGGDAESVAASMDCPLCASQVGVLPVTFGLSDLVLPLRDAPSLSLVAPLLLHAAAPPPARGPPLFS
ncbi:MAG: hypothetical protein RJA34_1583 [Pseudomonadota bacterium]|jgi:hypothetical protein